MVTDKITVKSIQGFCGVWISCYLQGHIMCIFDVTKMNFPNTVHTKFSKTQKRNCALRLSSSQAIRENVMW